MTPKKKATMDLSPTDDELLELEGYAAPALSWQELATLDYEELVRPKRSEADLFCPSWNDGCGCKHLLDTGSQHLTRDGTPWCPAHQQACEDGPHPFITLDQYIRRVQPTNGTT